MPARKTNGGAKRIYGFKLEISLIDELKTLGKKKDRPMSWLIRRAIRQYLDAQEERHARP
jgi:predicted transcriptional regulator